MKKLFEEIPVIEGERLILKRIEESDEDAIRELQENEKNYEFEPTFLFERQADAKETIKELYKDIFEKKQSLILGIYLKDEGSLCGLAEFYGYREEAHKASIGARLLERYWGMGIATETVGMMLGYLFNHTDVETVTASTMAANRNSENVLKKSGFTKTDSLVPEDWGREELVIVNKWIRAEFRDIEINLSDDASDFVLLGDEIPDAILEIRYNSTFNFVGERIDGYEEPIALITKEAAKALKAASDEFISKGYRIKVYDAYRPQKAVEHFMRWAMNKESTRMKEFFYPELEKGSIVPLGFVAKHSGHSRGSTVDLTLYDMKANKEVDMGGPFDFFGDASHPAYMNVTEEQYANRMMLREVMVKHGFRPLVEEWWHFTLDDEPFTDTYFTFPVNSNSVGK